MDPRAAPATLALHPPDATQRLGTAQRSLTETLLRVAELTPAAEVRAEEALLALAALEAELAPSALHDALPRLAPEPRGQRPYYVRGVVTPEHHPLRPDLEIAFADGATRGRVRFGVTFEGPPGCVHGGFVAHFLDQILGQHNLWAGIPAMTASLTVRYRRPTPILRELDFSVTHAVSEDSAGLRRKVTTRGALSADGVVFSEGEGLFVVPKGASWLP